MSDLNAYLYGVEEEHFKLDSDIIAHVYYVWVFATSPKEARKYLSKNYVKKDADARVIFSTALDWFNGNCFTKKHVKGEVLYTNKHYERKV